MKQLVCIKKRIDIWAVCGIRSCVSVKWWTKVHYSFTMLVGDDTRQKHPNISYDGINNTYSYFDDSRLLTLLQNKENKSSNLEEWLRTLEDFRNKYNISVVKECDRFDYCSGEIRNLIVSYNSIHGYISLLVSNSFIESLMCVRCIWVRLDSCVPEIYLHIV